MSTDTDSNTDDRDPKRLIEPNTGTICAREAHIDGELVLIVDGYLPAHMCASAETIDNS